MKEPPEPNSPEAMRIVADWLKAYEGHDLESESIWDFDPEAAERILDSLVAMSEEGDS